MVNTKALAEGGQNLQNASMNLSSFHQAI